MDYVLVDSDKAIFQPNFGAATVVVQPGKLQASGPAKLGQRKLCVAGDEQSVSVPGCSYTTPTHSIPGSGTLEISGLASDQQAQKANHGRKRLLLVGSQFTARFKVQQPAQQPTASGPVPDATPLYSGRGRFSTSNGKLRVT
jgi:hypothetical protein